MRHASKILVFVAAFIVAIILFPRQKGETDRLRDRAAMMDRACEGNRSMLKTARRHLWAPTTREQTSGSDLYLTFQLNEWQEINICAPENMWVGGACPVMGSVVENSERACMIHNLDWALAFVR